MSRAIIVLMCLSAACLVSCQVPRCPQEVVENPQKFFRSSYVFGSQIVRNRCSYVIRSGYAGIYFGPARLITKSYYVCEDKLSQLQLSGPGERPLYICEEDAVIEPFEPSEATSTPSEATDTPSETTQTPTQPPSVTTQQPTSTTQPPSVTTQRPTEPPTIAGGISECPRDSSSFRQSNYIYSSLSKIEQKACFLRIRIQGFSSTRRSSIWVCKEGFKREFVRLRQYRCVAALDSHS